MKTNIRSKTMKFPNLACRLSLLGIGSIFLSACATTGSKSTTAHLSSPTLERPTVAVLPFDAADYKSLQQNDRMVRDFERSYLPARLVRALSATPGIKAAYFSPGWTPAADYNVKGVIKKSDGKMTVLEIAVTAADGRFIWKRAFTVNTTSAEFKKQTDPASRLWSPISAAIATTKQRSGEFAVARTVGYSADKNALVTDFQAKISDEGAEAERHGLLDPSTKGLVSRSGGYTEELYVKWQRESTPLVEQRSGEKTAQVTSAVSSLLGGFAMGLGAATGDSSLSTSGANVMTTAINDSAVAQEKITEIQKTLSTKSQSLVWHEGKPLSIRVFGHVYSFTGSMEKQQEDLRKVVAAELGKANAVALR